MRRLDDLDVAMVVGMRGRGKTHHVKHEVLPNQPAWVVWDPKHEYGSDPGHVAHVVSFDQLCALEAAGDSLLARPGIKLVVRPTRNLRPAELSEQFGEFIDLISSSRNFVLVVDEVGLLTKHAEEDLVFLATQSRHWLVPVVFLAQRAVQIPVTAREQSSIVVSFRQKRKADIDALAEEIGEDLASKIRTLPLRECVKWDEKTDLAAEAAA